MAHWTRASSNAGLQNCTSNSPQEETKNDNCTEDCGALPFDLMKARVAERLMVGIRHGSASVEHAQQFSSNKWGAGHDICQEVGHKNAERGDGSSQCFLMQNEVNLCAAKAVVSNAFSIRKLSDLFLNFQNLVSSENQSSEWSHFPMFEINQKIDTILNPNRRSAVGTTSDNLCVPQQPLKVNMSTSNVMAFSSQEYQLHSHQITNENMDQRKSASGILSRLEDHTGLSSNPTGKKLKGHLSVTTSFSCSKDENNLSSSLVDEQRTSHYCANSKQEPSDNKLKFAPNNSMDKIGGNVFQIQKSRSSGGHKKQQDAPGVVLSEPVLGREYETEPINCFGNNKQDDENFHGTCKSHAVALASPSFRDEQQHLNTHRMDPAAKSIHSFVLPDATAYMFTVKSKGKALHHRNQPMDKFTDSSKRKGPCLSEILTIPCKSHNACSKDSLSSGKSTDFGVCMYGTNIGSHLLEVQNKFSDKIDTLYSDTYHVSKSSAGIASASAQKDSGCPASAKTLQLATPSMKGSSRHSKENEILDVNEEHPDASSKATCAGKQEPCLPRTETMNLDLAFFQISRMRNPISSALVQSSVCPEPRDRWLKRLQHDISASHVPGSKKSKVADGQKLFNPAFHYENAEIDMINHAKEDQTKLSDEMIELQCNREGSPVPSKSVNSWIGRWCQGGSPTTHQAPVQGTQATKSNAAPEVELEGHLPSIAAMAMMGRAMSKLRPSEHQRKGPLMVWKTEGL